LSVIREILGIEEPLEIQVKEIDVYPPDDIAKSYNVVLKTIDGKEITIQPVMIEFKDVTVQTSIDKSNMEAPSVTGQPSQSGYCSAVACCCITKIRYRFPAGAFAVFDFGVLTITSL